MAKKNHGGNHGPRLAYHDGRFLESADARVIRILSEYLDPQAHLRKAGAIDTVVFFGSARIRPRDVAVQHLRDLEARAKEGTPIPPPQLNVARMDIHMSRYYEAARELARMITEWAMQMSKTTQSLLVCSGGGPGIMEATNRGAHEAGGRSIGLNIKLPMEQEPNPYISPELSMLFHYFFMRKLWFAQPAQALIAFPGGFGTMDELFEILTLLQTRKMRHGVTVLLYGSKFWKKVVNFGYLLESGTISHEDLKLIRFVDSPRQAFQILKNEL
jgi:uncharacterized protein (TIGR00730 family)